MTRLVPAILTDSKPEFRRLLDLAREMTDYVQIDIMDGSFTENQTLLPREIFHENYEGLTFEAHIMASKPTVFELIQSLKSFPACTRVIVHREAADNVEELRQMVNRIKDLGKEVGIAINPGTDIREIGKVVKKINSVQFMGVVPGAYGGAFHPEVVNAVKDFQERYTMSPAEIAWDGAATKERIPELVSAGVESIAVGSAIFRTEDPVAAYRDLVELIPSD